ncbi:hypothetical protein C0989_003977, partial [Termitomyces sp. Mn162]
AFFVDCEDFITYQVPDEKDTMGVTVNETSRILGCGRVCKWVKFEGVVIEVTLEDMLHAPDLDHNLVSIGSLVQKGVKLGIDEGRAMFHAPDRKPSMRCPMSGTMFIVEFVPPPPSALAT